MKHCPQCEFTFDDHQHFCDFDGTELSQILERPPAFRKLSAPNVKLPSLVHRLLWSNVSLAVFALTGIVSSAILVGYYSATEVSKAKTRDSVSLGLANDSVALVVPAGLTPANSVTHQRPHIRRPATVTTRRARKATDSASLKSRRQSQRSAVVSSRTRSRTSQKLATIRRRDLKPQLAMKVAVDGSSRQMLATNQKRPEFLEQGTQLRSDDEFENVRVGSGDTVWTERESTGREALADRESENAPRKKDSKVMAVLKKTGRILTRPFRF